MAHSEHTKGTCDWGTMELEESLSSGVVISEEEAIADFAEVMAVAPSPPRTLSRSSSLRRSSIMKRRFSDVSLIKMNRGSYKCLPRPDVEAIRQRSEEEQELTDRSSGESSNSSVAFGSVMIRSYAQTLGDNPSVSYGPPISLDWEYDEHPEVTLDDYEDKRAPRRSVRQMVLSYYMRKNILNWVYGVSEDELSAAHTQVKREKLRRTVTCTLVPLMPVQAALLRSLMPYVLVSGITFSLPRIGSSTLVLPT